jgi:putative peptide zinc metalloprotease protein
MSGPLPVALPLLANGVRLKSHVDSYRHIYQGQVWYVFHDRAAHRYYRVSGGGAEVIGALDGRRGLEEVLASLQARDGADAPEAADVAQFVMQLNALDLLQTDAPPDIARLDARRAAMRRRRWLASVRSPLSFKIKLFDPTRLLDALLPWFGWVFGPVGAVLWLAVVGIGALIGLMHWQVLTQDATDRMLSTENLLVAGAVYPVVKILHELGHGVALRRLGAEVHQIGILLAAFIPVPYVDASASAVLERRRDRIVVGAAGILVEMFLGGVALILWSQAEPGALRAVCYNVIMISGFSTLLFNGNPLQRYDGYYILSDLAGIPGLGTRAAHYIAWLFRAHVMGDDATAAPAMRPAERWWFLIYGPCSFIYRFGLMLFISLFIAEKYPGLGLILAVWSVIGYVWPALSGLVNWTRKSQGPAGRRGAAGLATLAASLAVALFVVPAPHAVVAQGVIAMPDEANVRPQVGAPLVELLARNGQMVTAGQNLARLAEPATRARVRRLQARVAEMQARVTQAAVDDRARAAILGDELAQAQRELADAERDVAAMVVQSPASGLLILPTPQDLPGRFVQKGEAIATIWDPARAVIRTVTPMSDIALVRGTVRDIDVRPSWDVMQTLPARIVRVVPAATDTLPSAVLSLEGGGPFAVQRDRDNQIRMEEAAFEVDLQPTEALPRAFLNGRVHVRFALDPEPLGLQLWRRVRLVFLRRLHA